MTDVGVVIIGRNEGVRLSRCIASISTAHPVVYVDSGSEDGSCERARSLNALVIALDCSMPFTAARGRNAGLERLLQIYPKLSFVQFVDGDCEIHPEWIAKAIERLHSERSLAIVCGRLREKDTHSIYGRLCDMEWNGPTGDVATCGGVMMARTAALSRVGGFNEHVAAGEEADLCVRLRKAGFRIVRMAAEMGTHDAGMKRFSQWWRRARRAGQSYMQGALLHGPGDECRHAKAVRSIICWGGVFPLAIAVVALLTHGVGLLLVALYPLLWIRIFRSRMARGEPWRDAALFASFCLIAKFAQLIGVCGYLWRCGIQMPEPRRHRNRQERALPSHASH